MKGDGSYMFGHRGYTVVVENGLYRLRLHTACYISLELLDEYIDQIEQYSSDILRQATNNFPHESESE